MPDKVQNTSNTVERKEGELNHLSGDNGGTGSPSLPVKGEVTREMMLEYFADLLVHCALQLYEEQFTQKSSTLLQSINKRTG
ncbi:MAG: hypothetical protein HEQ40_12345 [Lacibacter sp.]